MYGLPINNKKTNLNTYGNTLLRCHRCNYEGFHFGNRSLGNTYICPRCGHLSFYGYDIDSKNAG